MTFKAFISKCEANFEELHLGFGPEYQEVEAVKIDDIDLNKIESLITSKTETLKVILKDTPVLQRLSKTGIVTNFDTSESCYYFIICTFSEYQISINFGDYLIWCKGTKRFIVLPEFEFNLFYRRK